jgi:hypothetical protein
MPTPKQLAYFNSLVKKVAEKRGVPERDIHQELGLVEANAWGGRLRTEAITKASVSRHIDTLKGRL